MGAFALELTSQGVKEHYEFEYLPSVCPHCHNRIIPTILRGFVVNDYEVNLFLHCPDREECGKGFLAVYKSDYQRYILESTTFGKPLGRSFNTTTTSLSPQFVQIYNQSYLAEQYSLFEICGVGYRKALEFLIKDYVKLSHPGKEETIEKQLLSACIHSYVSDSRIKSVAKRAVWLGNDETHYVRKWEGKNLDDLKKLIELTIHWIEMEILTQSFEDDMPEGK